MKRIAAVFGLSVLTLAAQHPAARAQRVQEITYALASKSLVTAGPRLAAQMGLFAKHGLHANFVYLDSAASATTALLSGSVDFAGSAPAEVIAAVAKGQNIVIVANHYTGYAGSLVLSQAAARRLGVAADAPIAARLKALDGLMIASTTRVSNLTVGFRGATNAAGATLRFSYMALPAMQAAMEVGAIDGFIATAPFWSFPVIKGTGVLWIARDELSYPFVTSSSAVTITMRKTADANPDLMRKMTAVFDELSVANAEKPDEFKAALVQLFPDLDATMLDLIYKSDGKAFISKPLEPSDITRDLEFMRLSGLFDAMDGIDPAKILLKR